MQKLLLILLTLLISATGYSQTFTAQDSNNNTLRFTVTSSNTVSLTTGSTIINTNVDIPSTVSDGGITYDVTGIGDFALGGGSQQLTSVNLPNTLISIGEQSLSQNNFTGIVLPNSLTSIGDYAFQSNQIQGLTIPSNVTTIGNGAFRGNPLVSITSLATTPPVITTEAGNNDSFATGGDRSGINLTIPAGTTGAYVSDSGALWTGFNTVTENLNIGDTYEHNFITYEIVSVANSIAKAVDYDTTGGTSVTIPATIPNGQISYNITEIGSSAFSQKNLTTVSIANSITHIESFAFFDNNITAIILPDGITSIELGVFRDNNLASIIIPDGVTSIANDAFRGNAITSVTLPNTVTTIGIQSFQSNAITSLILPNSVTSLGSNAFSVNQIANLTLPDGITNLPNSVFAGNQLTSITIPSSVTSIDINAFGSNLLADITIPQNVTSIGNLAFTNNPLTDVTSLASTPPTITTGTNDTFNTDRSNIHLHLLPGTTAAYTTDSGALWTGFNPVTEDATLSVSNLELEEEITLINTPEGFTIETSTDLNLLNYCIYNMTGQEVDCGKETNIRTSSLASGIYILRLQFNRGILTKKFGK